MPAFLIPAIMAGASALGGYLGNRKKTLTNTQKQSRKSTNTSSSKSTSSSMPTYDPLQGSFRDQLIGQYLDRMQPWQAGQFADIATTSAVQNINRGSDIQGKLARQALASRGLNFSPAAGALESSLQGDRISQIIQARNNQPLMVDELIRQRLSDASGFFSSLPTGSTTTTEGTQTSEGMEEMEGSGTTTDPGNPMGGLFNSLAETLAGLYAEGAFGGVKKSGVTPGIPWSQANNLRTAESSNNMLFRNPFRR